MLKALFKSFFLTCFFWMIFFFICRSIFLLYNAPELSGVSLGEILSTFRNAFRLDISMASYFLGFSFLMIGVSGILPAQKATSAIRIVGWIHSGYLLMIVFLFSLITVSELEIYHEWGTKLNIKALRFLGHPSEVIGSTSTVFLILGSAGVALLSFAGFFLFRKLSPLPVSTATSSEGWVKKTTSLLVFSLVVPALLVLGIRGGWQQIPIQQSDAYFSKHNILNLAAVNSGWNLGQSIWENKKNMEGNPYVYYPFDQAKSTVGELYSIEKDTTISFLKTNRPNVVMVILESWSADMVRSLGGYDSVTRHFDELAKDGIMLDSAFANGSLSDQGMTCLFSGFPSLPSYISIIGQPAKYGRLPCMNTELHEAGYSTSFLFGGQLSYGNIKAYMYYNRFGRILEGEDFSSDIPRGKLGVHDEFLYERQLQELRKEKQPFFASMFTLSSHSPYDMPMEDKDKADFGGDEKNYVNSMRYADQKLFEFLQKAKKEKWFENTLFVFVADHSHRSPRHFTPHQPEYRRIPIMFWGNAIKEEFRGYRHKKIASQLDLTATLLKQLGLSSAKYGWSKNIFNPYSPPFAFYETFEGFGYIKPGQYLVYSHPDDRYLYEQTVSPEEKAKMEKEGKSFLQVMFQEYTDY